MQDVNSGQYKTHNYATSCCIILEWDSERDNDESK